ncbi:MAG: S8 family serine peptidase [Fischerella sp.]|jgi:subtilisin family serine protease|uniref:S8 family serine peptidase n=1 Tax=Fischerella sp. TaxID=1191 RepID=UPI0018273384|nr:S8 family serine peptidase [Fischerella sp.]NWF62025.1 S8 family serine peptidase [Fischerella sp.]
MPIDNRSHNLFDDKGLNITPASSVDSLNYQDNRNFNFSSHSSFQTTENALEPDVNELGRKSRKSTKAKSSKAAKADLVIQNASAPSVATAGSTIQISYQVKNKGKNNAGFNYTNFYLSKDKSISNDDSFLGWNWIGSIEAGNSVSQSQNVTLDSNIASGNYFLLYRADALDNVLETNNSNNVVAREINITGTGGKGYNSTSGYGLIDASAAVAKAIGQNTFADVPDLGGNNWGADMVKAPEVWAKGYTGEGVIVAVVDTGVDYNHPDFSTNIWTNSKEIAGNGKDDDGNGYIDDVYGWNFDGNNNNSFDDNGHGTHVAGTIAGVKNSFGVTGIAYNAKIMSVKVMDSSGQGYYSAIANGVRYAVNNGARVINLSLGGSSSDSYLQSAVQYAASKGAIVVMAAGNNGGSVPDYPARYAENWGLAVGAVDKYNNLASFSNRAGTNPLAYVTAPGVNIYSTIPGNKYASYSGTSMATPHVAGVVALMLSANPNLTDSQVRQIITQISGTTTQSKVATTTYTANGDAATFRISASSFSSNNIATSSDTVISSNSTNSVDKNNLFENLHTWTDFGNDYKNSVADTSYMSISSEEYTQGENIVKNGKKPLETVYEIVG